ncbi:MAG: hypothetical protein M1828_003307 [Chrysothrix sp. TS-e1954]|nr:MAG: hypothetical protein M1828_003307 [Chrysothrix sp. TS-e1954]
MPYNTRRISLSLTSLGIAIPGKGASRSHRSPSDNRPSSSKDVETPPAKRVKRSHTINSTASSTSSPATPRRSRNASSASDPQPGPTPALPEHTPPPSPGATSNNKIDKDGIKDDVVVAVLDQLESTGNRPHLIRELAAVLSPKLKTVESSSNPNAIISSRLTNYLRRPWTALAPCPLSKEQVTQHPRRVYYYLVTMPKQSIPRNVEATPPSHIITPSVSSGPDEEDVAHDDGQDVLMQQRPREDLSPSPEMDLSAPELDFNGNTSALHDMSFRDPNNASFLSNTRQNRSSSEPLEFFEREFNRAASDMEARKKTELAEQAQLQAMQTSTPRSQPSPVPSEHASDEEAVEPPPTMSNGDSPASVDETPEELFEFPETTPEQNDEAAAALFGTQSQQYLSARAHDANLHSSPMIRPVTTSALPTRDVSLSKLVTAPARTVVRPNGPNANGDVKVEDEQSSNDWWEDLKSPENVGLNELDELLGAY